MKLLRRVLMVLGALLAIAAVASYVLLRASLPKLDGSVAANLKSPVKIERDSLGIATITGSNRVDLAYATGYAHGQDRYFQMDLQRRVSAGELSELLGKSMIENDKRFRRHNFRAVAKQVVANATPEQQEILKAYVDGVNAARESATARSFEYLLLGQQPRAWALEDCVLVAFAMYIDLNDSDGAHELERARLHNALPESVFNFLYPRGTEWDAPLDGVDLSSARVAIPSAETIDLRKGPPLEFKELGAVDADYPGSNNWAVAGTRTANGGAIVANDMHLGLRLAHIWYRARLIVNSDDAALNRDLIGVTLPGLPLLVAGSNRHIAWGYTNTHGDYDDLIVLETNDDHPNRYRDGDQWREFVTRKERIAVRGEPEVDVIYRDTIWGPVMDASLDGKLLALAWTAQHPDATNFGQLALETAKNVDEALPLANVAGIPVQNFVVADEQGHIAWTPIGRLPKRNGFDGRLPACWGCNPNMGWTGWRNASDYPRIVNPDVGQLWSANSRTLGGDEFAKIGDEDMDRGARTKQIRDDLLAMEKIVPQDMLKVQLDDRALFLTRWRNALLGLLDDAYVRAHPAREHARDLANAWTERASVDDAGYRIVRAFRMAVQEDVYRSLIAPAQKKYPDAKFKPSARFEDSLWQVITEQPAQLLNPKYENWDAQLLASLDRALEKLQAECRATKLSDCTWGKRNTLNMAHPLASSLPVLGRWLHMPYQALPGDNDMPRVQGKAFGASERFAVSPGHEDEGYFHMPGGQSGHPLSPYFSAGHDAWVKGEPTPFMPGTTEHTLTLSPQ